MTIYLHCTDVPREKLDGLNGFFEKSGYNKHSLARSEFMHPQPVGNPYVAIENNVASIDHLSDCQGLQRVVDFLVRQLRPTYWNSDMEIFTQDAEEHYAKKQLKIDLPYVPLDMSRKAKRAVDN